MKTTIKISAIAIALMSFTGCMQGQKSDKDVAKLDVMAEEPTTVLVGEVLSQKQQEALSPDDVIKSLADGNTRFINNNLTARNHSKQVKNSVSGQFPEAVILSCVDSRVPVEDVFDRGIGDIFVARVAGNFANEDILGSMEFACAVSGSKLVLVMGHNHCGAVRAAVDDVKLGNITPMLQKIKPAVAMVDYKGDRTSGNLEFVEMANHSNVKNTISNIRKNSPILKEMEYKGEIKIVGAVYNLETGKVDWLN
ncbi:carbonic anhydrase family protein [Aequorivita capsosiphonis]|uniref:carbonic anhydrase family protein n=1 Tax=Aequorivita capsosiphonis TaxID=487317 RepID=UPI000424227E|nr:carbonic anhydrase family protein [Aequorivita capsosiphonis]